MGIIGRVIGKVLFGGAKARRVAKGLGKQVGHPNKLGQKVYKKQITKAQANGYEHYKLTTINFDGSVAGTVDIDKSYTHSRIRKETPISGTNARNKIESMTWKKGEDYSRPRGYDNYTSSFTHTTRSYYDPKSKRVTKEISTFSMSKERETGGVNQFEHNVLKYKI